MAIWHVAPLRFAPASRALEVCEHIWPFSLRNIWATLLSPKWAEFLSPKWLLLKRPCPALINSYAHAELHRLLAVNQYRCFCSGVCCHHCIDQHFWYGLMAKCLDDDWARDPIKRFFLVQKYPMKFLAFCSELLAQSFVTNMASTVPFPGMNPNCESLMWITCRSRPSIIFSNTLKECSRSFTPRKQFGSRASPFPL